MTACLSKWQPPHSVQVQHFLTLTTLNLSLSFTSTFSNKEPKLTESQTNPSGFIIINVVTGSKSFDLFDRFGLSSFYLESFFFLFFLYKNIICTYIPICKYIHL